MAVEEEEAETQLSRHDRPEENKIVDLLKYKSWLILSMVGRKLIINPNNYACLAGLLWSLISNRYDFMGHYIDPNRTEFIFLKLNTMQVGDCSSNDSQ